MPSLKGLFILNPKSFAQIYSAMELNDIQKHVEIYAPPQTAQSIRENLGLLEQADVIFSGWGGPLLDEDFLAAAPRLKAFFYGAGTIRALVTDAFWRSGILITSAAAANAVPVAEFTLAQIILSLRLAWRAALDIKREGRYSTEIKQRIPGVYRTTVGLISLGLIGRMVAEHLRILDVHVIAYDPFVQPETAAQLNLELCATLDEVFQRAEVVSLHTPWLKETEGMITGAHFRQMKPNATFINTARGAVVREAEMIEVLQQRPDLTALLDVTYPEPPAEASPLLTLPNIVLTPHLAGSTNQECERMGRYMVEELERFVKGEPLRYGITREQFQRMA